MKKALQRSFLAILLGGSSLLACTARVPFNESTASTQAIILSPTENRFYLFDLLTHRIQASVYTGNVPQELVLGSGGLFFISNPLESSISVFQRADRQTLLRIGKIGTLGIPDRLAYNPTHNELYVTLKDQPRMVIYRVRGLRQPSLVQAINFPAETQIGPLAVASDGQSIYVADEAEGELYQVNRSSEGYSVSTELRLPEQARVRDLLVHKEKLFLLDQYQDKLYVVNTGQKQLDTTIELKNEVTEERPILPERMVVNQAGTKLYITGNAASIISVVDVANLKLLQNIQLQGESELTASYGPLGIDISNDDQRVYVTAQSGRNLAILETSPDLASNDRLLRNIGTRASAGNLRPLGPLKIMKYIN